MSPVDSPRLLNEANEASLHDQILEQNDSIVSDSLPTSPCDKPTNGGGDIPNEHTDDDSRKLFVGGLSWETNENDLREYFSNWGKVTQCIIKLDRLTGNSRGFGFVTMENEDCVCKVLSVPEHRLKNKKIDPKKAKPSREPLRKVFVGGIDPDVTEEQIREYFSSFGKVESLDLPFDPQKGKRKHYIFVSFATEVAARRAIAKERQEIFGRQCDVRVAVTREQANRQKALKQWYTFNDPRNIYPSYAYKDLSNVYSGFETFPYNYFGYEYYGNAAAAAAYSGYPNLNQFSGPKAGTQRNSTGAIPTGCNQRMMGSAGAPGSLANQHSQQPQSHNNFNLLNPSMDHPSMSSGLDFSVPHLSHSTPGLVANATAGYPHP